MRTTSFFLLISLSASVCFAQSDTTRRPQTPTKTQVLIPGVDSPVSAPGALMQSSPQPNTVSPQNGRNPKTTPPSDPRAFGVGIPIGKPKKDTLTKKTY